MHKITGVLLLAMCLLACRFYGVGNPNPPDPKITAFNLNSSIVLDLYNAAQKYVDDWKASHPGQDYTGNQDFNNYPANLNPSALQVTIDNSAPGAVDVVPCIQVSLYDNKGTLVVWGCPISTKNPVPAGQRAVLTAMDFTSSTIAFSGGFNQNFDSDINNVKNADQGLAAAKKYLSMTFKACAQVIQCGSNCQNGLLASNDPGACSFITIMAGQPGAHCVSAVPSSPVNKEVSSALPLFSWTPARDTNNPNAAISYTLEIMEETPDSEPKQRVEVPTGASSYQWNAAGYALQCGKKYFWRVISRDNQGKPFCGTDGQGSSTVSWFTLSCKKCGPVAPPEADRIAREKAKAAGATSELDTTLSALKPVSSRLDDGSSADDLLCRLRDGKAKVQSFELVKH